jgi:hypothetical protein
MKSADIKPGRIYEARHPKPVAGRGKLYDGKTYIDDRLVLWINHTRTRVQWDGPSVRSQGGKLQVTDMRVFLKWVGREITSIMTDGEWREWQFETKEEIV